MWLIVFATKQCDVSNVRFCLIVQNENSAFMEIYLGMRETLINVTNKENNTLCNLFCTLVPYVMIFCEKHQEMQNQCS